MAKCLKCGNELKDGQKFCMKCGTPVSANPQQAVAKQVTAPAVCAKCGNPLNPGQKFCMKCGQPVPQQPMAPQPMQPQAPQPAKSMAPGQPQPPHPMRPQVPQPPRPQQPMAPRPQAPQAPKPIQPQAPQPPVADGDEKGFFSRVGSGIASSLTGGSFSRGYDQQRQREETNENLINGIPLKLEDAKHSFAQLKKQYPDAIESVDEIEFEQLVAAVQDAARDASVGIAAQNGRIKKALAALDKKLADIKARINPASAQDTNGQQARQHHLTTAELHDINPDELAVVEHKATWGIQRGQIARRITERELDAVEGLNGVIIQQGCSAMIFVNGNLVKVMDAGAYQLQVKSDQEMKKLIDSLTNQLMQNHKEKVTSAAEAERQRLQNRSIAQRGGLVGIAGSWIKSGLEFVFGAAPVGKKNDKNRELDAMKRFKAEAEKIAREENKQPLLSIILISNRFFNLTFGGVPTDDGITFNPYVIPMGFLDVNIGVELEMHISDIGSFATNYLTDHNSLTTNDVFKMLNFDIENTIRQELRNMEYTQEGLPAPVRNQLAQRIQSSINSRLYGLECTKILNITDSQDDVFGRFRQVEKEIYCSEKELEYMTRTGEIRNRMEQEQNSQLINSARNKEDYSYAMQQIDKDHLLHEDEMAEFVLMLETQRQIREATTKEEAYEKLLVLQGNRLVKEDELETIKDAIEHEKINRAEITNIMRIQSNRNVEMERQQAEWALDDSKTDHDWEREDLARKRNWGIEDEQRERDWMQEEREYDRQRGRLKAEDDYDFEKMMRQRSIDQEDHALQRQEQLEDEARAYERQRQEQFDKDQLEANRSQRQMQNLETAMKLQMMQEAQEQQHEQQMANIKSNEQVNRDNLFANMTAEQIRAAQLSHLSSEAQVAMANAYSKDGEAELLRQQAQASEERAAKDKADLMNFAKEMAGMIKETATGVSGAQQMQQQQQIDQLRADNQRMAERVDHTQDQALNAVGNVAASAASNIHTSHVKTEVSVSQPQQSQPNAQQPEQQPELMECECYQCHQIIRIAPGTPQCPLCGAPFAWE